MLLLPLAVPAAAMPAESLTGHPLVLGSYDEAVFEVETKLLVSSIACSSLHPAIRTAAARRTGLLLPLLLFCRFPLAFATPQHALSATVRPPHPHSLYPVSCTCVLRPTNCSCNHSPAMTCGSWQQHSCSHYFKSCAGLALAATAAAKHASMPGVQTAWTPLR